LRNPAESLLDEIFGIEEDDRGALWIATSKHVLRASRVLLLNGDNASGGLRDFGSGDGIPAPEGVRRDRSIVKDPAGDIWLSLRRGISLVEPERADVTSVPAIVHIHSVFADGSPADGSGTLRIPANPRRVSFEFLALSLSVPARVQ